MGLPRLAVNVSRNPDIDLYPPLAERYRLVRLIGSGGMGSVFEAEDLRLGRACAVKVLREDVAIRPNARRRLDREASLLGRLVHENIVALLDVGVTGDGQTFLVLEYLRGRTLRAELQQSGVRSVQRTLEIVTQVARGLGHAHSAGVVHRDLKPENIMLTAHADGRLLVKLLDFGVARQRDGSGETITATDTAIGTAAYMAPEQARGERALHATTDVYALGAVVYEALAGRRPYDGGSYNETLFQILNHRHEPIADVRPDLPRDLCAAIERALEKSPKERFPGVLEFAAALGVEVQAEESEPKEALGSLAMTVVSSEDHGDHAKRRPQRSGFAWRVIGAGVVGAVLGALAFGGLSRASRFAHPAPVPMVLTPSSRPEPATKAAVVPPTPESAHVAPVLSTPDPATAFRQDNAATKALPTASSTGIPRARPPRSPSRGAAGAIARPNPEPSSRVTAVEASAGPPQSRAAFPFEDRVPSGYIADSPYGSMSVKQEP
jgi:eukaryotic-like serine/threonine-protein kinase